MTVSVTKEETYTKTVPYETVKEQTDTLYVGSTKVEVEGSDGEVQYVDKVEYVDGMEISRENISTVTVKEAVDKKILVGTKKKATVTTSTKPLRWWLIVNNHAINAAFQRHLYVSCAKCDWYQSVLWL